MVRVSGGGFLGGREGWGCVLRGGRCYVSV